MDKSLGQQIETYLPANIHKLEYQIEAVKRCISIMHEHGGFMLADVVGLGKTIIGTLIIKRFLSVPEDDGRERKVLVITPPAIQSGWKKTITMFDKDSDEKIAPYIDFITTGMSQKMKIAKMMMTTTEILAILVKHSKKRIMALLSLTKAISSVTAPH